MKFILNYFDSIGFFTEFNLTSKVYQKSVRFIFILYLTFGAIAGVLSVNYIHRKQNDILGGANDIFKLQGFQIFYWVTFMESFIKRKSFREFWQILNTIYSKYNPKRRSQFKRFFVQLFIGVNFFALSHFTLISLCFTNHGKYQLFWSTFVVFIILLQCRIFYNLLLMELIKNELEIIHQELEKMFLNFSASEDICKFVRKNSLWIELELNRLKWMREYHSLIFDLCTIFNSACGWSKTVSIIFSFLLLLCDINWIYWKWYNQLELIYLTGTN